MVNAGETIIDATMAAFPNQNVVMPIGRNTSDLDPSVDYLSETVVDYAATTYGRFITTRFSLSATTDDPSIDALPYITGRSSSISARMWLVKCCGM